MQSGEQHAHPAYSDPRQGFLNMITDSNLPEMFSQEFEPGDVDLLSERSVVDLSSPFSDSLLTVGSFLAIIRGLKIPVWKDRVPGKKPDLADASWVDGYVSGCFMMSSEDEGKHWYMGMGSFGPTQNVPPVPVHGHLCINPWIGIATAGIVYNSQVERLEIELADGAVYSDTVTDRVLHILAPLQNETNRNGSFTSRLIARSGEIIEQGVIPICSPMPDNLTQ